MRKVLALALLALGSIAARDAEFDKAKAEFKRAVAELGMKPVLDLTAKPAPEPNLKAVPDAADRLAGTDASSNALFGSLQQLTANNLGLNPILTATANSTGGVMGKMIDAQSICVATAATDQIGKEADIFKFVVWHSFILAAIVGLIVMLQAYVFKATVPLQG